MLVGQSAISEKAEAICLPEKWKEPAMCVYKKF